MLLQRQTVETVGWPRSALHSGPYSQTLQLSTSVIFKAAKESIEVGRGVFAVHVAGFS